MLTVNLYMALDMKEEAIKVYKELLAYNPENFEYYRGLQKAMGLLPSAGIYLNIQNFTILWVLCNVANLFWNVRWQVGARKDRKLD